MQLAPPVRGTAPAGRGPGPDAVAAPGLLTSLRALVLRPARYTHPRPATRRLFGFLATVTLGVTVPFPLLEGGWTDRLVLVVASLALTASWVLTYRRRRVGLFAELVDALAVFALAVASHPPSAVFPVLVSALWFRSLYGSAVRAYLRPVVYSVALAAAVLEWPSILGHHGTAEGAHVLSVAPMLVITVVVARRLAMMLRDRERAELVADVYAHAAAELIGVHDDVTIRRVAAKADQALCDAVPGLRIAKVDEDGAGLAVIGVRGPWVRELVRVPRALVGGPHGVGESVKHAVLDAAPLDAAAGEQCAWLALSLPLVDRLDVRSWLLVGAPGEVPRGVVRALRNLANHMSLAYAVSEAHGELTARASTDPLTGLANRSAFTAALESALAAPPGSDVSVLFVDLDGFKAINDGFGHQAGDQVLVEVATRLRRAARPGDVCARLGGDEFAILLPGADADAAEAAAARVRTAIGAPLRRASDVTLPLSASVGSATALTGSDADSLMRVADDAMYAAKRARA